MSELAAVFLDAIANPSRVRIIDIEAQLMRMVDRAHIAWPELAVAAAPFVAHVARCLADGEVDETSLSALRIDDLALAFACGTGSSDAIWAFEQHYADHVRAIVARFGESAELTDEVHQRLRTRLFVAQVGEPPGIWSYTGRGGLLAFIRTAALRITLDLLRARDARREVDDAALAELPAADDPELRYLKLLYRRELKAAFEAAFASLPPRARTLIRHTVVDRLSIDKIAAIYDLHRTTISRQLHETRRALVEGTRGELARKLRLSPGELDSVMRFIQSDVDLSIERLAACD